MVSLKLNLKREKLKELHEKLKEYRYIDELSDIPFIEFEVIYI